MFGLVLLGLLGVGATATLIVELVDDDDDNGRSAPETPGEKEPQTGGPGPIPDDDGTITGTATSDQITGTVASDPILAQAGDDIVRGEDGDDIIGAGDGDDRVFGDDGEDTITGQAGDDFLRGSAGDDVIFDSQGADTLRGDAGDDIILSTGFTDQDAFLDAVLTDNGQAPNITAQNIPGFDLSQDQDTQGDVVDGGVGDDTIFFGNGDTITGGEGLDFFVGADTLIGGDPAEITDFDISEETLVFTTEAGTNLDIDITYDGDDATVLLDNEAVVLLRGVGTGFTLANLEVVERPA